MPPAPATRAATSPKGGGKQILGMPRTQFFVMAGIGAGLIITFIIWRRKKAAAATAAAPSAGTCPDGSTPDANGNCPQAGTDVAGQLATLQTEIGDLQAAMGAGGGGSAGTGAGATGTTGSGSSAGSGTVNPGGPAAGTTPAAPSTPGTTGGGWKYPAPTGLRAYAVSDSGFRLSWNAVTGPSGQHPATYTVRMSGPGVNYSHVVNGTSAIEYGWGGAGLKPATTYTATVWANGGPIGPPGATVTVTTLKRGA